MFWAKYRGFPRPTFVVLLAVTSDHPKVGTEQGAAQLVRAALRGDGASQRAGGPRLGEIGLLEGQAVLGLGWWTDSILCVQRPRRRGPVFDVRPRRGWNWWAG